MSSIQFDIDNTNGSVLSSSKFQSLLIMQFKNFGSTDTTLSFDDEVKRNVLRDGASIAREQHKKEKEEDASETVNSKQFSAKAMDHPRINPFRVSESLSASVGQITKVSLGRGRGRGRSISKHIVAEDDPTPGPTPPVI